MRITILLFTAAMTWLFLASDEQLTIPQATELQMVSGKITHIKKVYRSNSRRNSSKFSHIDIMIQTAKGIRELQAFDPTLIDEINLGDNIEAGVYTPNGASNIWTFHSSSGASRSYQDTYQLRANTIATERKNRPLFIFLFLAAMAYILYKMSVDKRRA